MRPSAEQQLDNEARRLIDLAVQIALKDSDTEDVVERDVAQDVSAEPELFGDLGERSPRCTLEYSLSLFASQLGSRSGTLRPC